MRRPLGVILIGIGAFALILAILLPTVVVPRSKKIPLDLNITQISSGPASILNAETGEHENAQLRATRLVRTDSHASNGTYTTVEESLCIVVVEGTTPNCVPSSDPRLLSYSTDRVTVNRKNGLAVNIAKYGENVNGNTSVKHEGVAYAFPIDTKKKTYKFFNPDINQASDATYEGTETRHGMKTYKFVSDSGTVPYKILGTLPGTYNDVRTVWVEPRTGVIIDGTEHQTQKLENGTVALDTTLSFEKSAIDYQKHFAQTKIDALNLAGKWAPLGLGLIGIIAIVGGVLLFRSSGTAGAHSSRPATADGPSDYDTDEAESNHDGLTGPVDSDDLPRHRDDDTDILGLRKDD